MSVPVERQRLIVGRNYIETLILTFTQLEFTAGVSLDAKLEMILKLEEELCALSMTHTLIRNIYHDTLLKLIKEEFPDISPPQFKSCFASRALREWITVNANLIHQGAIYFSTTGRLREEEKALLARLLRTAIMAAFYHAGVISLTPTWPYH